jgi:hypothetical protein
MEVLPRELLSVVFWHASPFGPVMRWVCARWRGALADVKVAPANGRFAHEDLAASGCAPLAAWARAANGGDFSTARANRMLLAAARGGAEETFALILSWRETVPLRVCLTSGEAQWIAAEASKRGRPTVARQARIWLEVAKEEESQSGLLRLSLPDLLRLVAGPPAALDAPAAIESTGDGRPRQC